MPSLTASRNDAFDVLVVGDYCLDLVFTGLPSLPELGREVVAAGFEQVPGGAFNTAVALHRLGARVAWATDFGTDDYSQFVLGRARAEGLDERGFVHHARPLRNLTVAASFPQDRAFLAYYDPAPALPAAAKALATLRARVLYIPGLYAGPLLDAAMLVVRLKRMTVVMDGNSYESASVSSPRLRRALGAVDVLTPNAAEAFRLTGEADLIRALQVLGERTPCVVIKDGGGGAYGIESGVVVHSPALPVTPLDTTGAGDVFDAGFLAARLEGRPLAECLRWGNVVAGLSTLAAGGTGRVVTRADVEARLDPPRSPDARTRFSGPR
jgi:sugar/nucleoside kinase (ribokinase family)